MGGGVGSEARKRSARASDPLFSVGASAAGPSAPQASSHSQPHPQSQKDLGPPPNCAPDHGPKTLGPGLRSGPRCPQLTVEGAGVRSSSISPPPLCQPFTALISRGPCAGVIYSLPDISPSAAEKFIWS